MKYEIEIESMEDGNCICYFYINGEKKKFEEMTSEEQKATAYALYQCSNVFMEAAFHDDNKYLS